MREMLAPTVESALRYAPACALAAIVANELLFTANRRTIGVITSEIAAFQLLRAWFSG